MRFVTGFAMAFLMVGACSSAQAFENFIPTGAGYSTNVSSLPALNSAAEAVDTQSDIYETELYNRQLEARRRESYLQRFMSNSETAGSDFSIDY